MVPASRQDRSASGRESVVLLETARYPRQNSQYFCKNSQYFRKNSWYFRKNKSTDCFRVYIETRREVGFRLLIDDLLDEMWYKVRYPR